MTLARRLKAAGLDWLVPAWDAPETVQSFVTTRNAGTDDAFDLGPAHLDVLAPEARSIIIANRERISSFLPSPPVYLEQVHGTLVANVDAGTLAAMRERAPIADGAVTRLADVPLSVRVADCLPVLLADDRGSVVGVAHAGWRGLAAGVLEATVSAMQVEAWRLVAWLGPAIGPTAFEVGSDVRDAFCDVDADAIAHFDPIRERKWLADLPALARMRLSRAGVMRVADAAACTFSDPFRFFSFRRDRGSARMGAFLWRNAQLSP